MISYYFSEQTRKQVDIWMVAIISAGVYNMKDRLVILNHNANSYRKALKKLNLRCLRNFLRLFLKLHQYTIPAENVPIFV